MADNYKGRYENSVNALPEGQTRNYIVDRVIDQIGFYSRNSGLNQKRFKRFSVAAIILNGIIPVAVLFSDIQGIGFGVKVLIAALSSAAGILGSITALMNYRELWVNYRVSCELLKALLDRFFLKTGEFAEIKGDEQKCLDMLQRQCEDIMTREHTMWKQSMSSDKGN